MTFEVRLHRPDPHGPVVVAPVGDVDLDTATRLRAAFAEALNTGAAQVVVDLAEVGFMDSTGIGQLAWLAGRCRETGTLVVANTRPLIRNALRLMGLDVVMTVHEYGAAPPAAGVADTS